jgi:putative ABC transport system permease protein
MTGAGRHRLAERLLGMGRDFALLLTPARGCPARAGGADVAGPEADDGLARLTDSFHLNLTAFGVLAFAVGIFIVHAAIGLAFEQRRPSCGRCGRWGCRGGFWGW